MTTIYETSQDRLAALVELCEPGDANAAAARYLRAVLGVCSEPMRYSDPMDPAAWADVVATLPMVTAGDVERLMFNRQCRGLELPTTLLDKMADPESLSEQDPDAFGRFLTELLSGVPEGSSPVRMLFSVAVSARGRAVINNFWIALDRTHPLMRRICHSAEQYHLEFDYYRQRLTLDLDKLADPEARAQFEDFYPFTTTDASDDVSTAANHFPVVDRAR
jgi:hypothetical protein